MANRTMALIAPRSIAHHAGQYSSPLHRASVPRARTPRRFARAFVATSEMVKSMMGFIEGRFMQSPCALAVHYLQCAFNQKYCYPVLGLILTAHGTCRAILQKQVSANVISGQYCKALKTSKLFAPLQISQQQRGHPGRCRQQDQQLISQQPQHICPQRKPQAVLCQRLAAIYRDITVSCPHSFI